MNKLTHAFLTMLVLALTAASASASAQTTSPATDSPQAIKEMMWKACDYIVSHPESGRQGKDPSNGWIRAALYTGVMAAYHTTQDQRYMDAAMKWSESNQWKPAKRRHADDQCCGSTYAELYFLKKDPAMIAPIKAAFDQMLASPQPGRKEWWWCDSLFMAPPAMVRLAKATDDPRYIELMDTMWWDTIDFLYDKPTNLIFRDKKYFDKKTASGQKVFWSRGNGWVLAGTCRVLQYLPENHPHRAKYIQLLQNMAKAIAPLQGEDGLWRTSLLDAQEYPAPETSGSGFFCFAMAWGINNGHLDRATYLPTVQKAWKGLTSCLHPDGKLGNVQPVGADPRATSPDLTQEYGVGAFLLAGSEILKFEK